MAKVKDLNLHTKPVGQLMVATRLFIFWGTLIAALYVSRLLLGGHWVVDILAAVLAVFALVSTVSNYSGESVNTTREELLAWLHDGSPPDFLAWRRARANITYFTDTKDGETRRQDGNPH